MKITSAITKLLDVPTTDPDDARRRKLLNILLFGLAMNGLLLLLTMLVADVADLEGFESRGTFFYLSCFALLASSLFVFVINRYWSGWIASSIFLLLMLTIFTVIDKPQEVVDGRSLFFYAIPIMLGSVLLPPYASFVVAGLSSVIITVISINLQLIPNPFAMVSFFLLALVSWLPARALERALRDLRVLNLELERRLIEKTELVVELEELDNRKSEFLSTVSHELRTPLTAIKGSIENVLSGMYGPVTDKQRDRLRIALTGVNDEARLVENLLDLVRIQENKVTLEMKHENVADIVRSIVQVFEYDAGKRGVDLQVDLPTGDALQSRLDRGKLKQVLTNLVGNAIKFTPEKGTVVVSASGDEKWIEVQVKDTGIGIPATEHERIFDKFYQVDTSLTRQVGGAGIGLSIVKEYVTMHGGKISVQSEPGQGSTFTFRLPRRA